MAGESFATWRVLLDDLIARGLRTPEFLIANGSRGRRAIAGGALACDVGSALHGAHLTLTAPEAGNAWCLRG